MVADDLIPGDRFIEPDGLERFLIIDGVGSDMGAGAGGNELAVQDIDIPSQLVILGVVDRITEGNAEIERRFFMQGIDRLDGGIEDLGRRVNDRRIG